MKAGEKHYDEMNFAERRKYRIWLRKNNLWDGAMVIERLVKEKRLIIGDFKPINTPS